MYIGDDCWKHILSFIDLNSLIKTSRTCKYLHTVCKQYIINNLHNFKWYLFQSYDFTEGVLTLDDTLHLPKFYIKRPICKGRGIKKYIGKYTVYGKVKNKKLILNSTYNSNFAVIDIII